MTEMITGEIIPFLASSYSISEAYDPLQYQIFSNCLIDLQNMHYIPNIAYFIIIYLFRFMCDNYTDTKK